MEFVHRPGVEVEGGGDGGDLASSGHNRLPRIGGFERGELLLVATHEVGDGAEHIASASHGRIAPHTLIEPSSGDLDCRGDVVRRSPGDRPDLLTRRRVVDRGLTTGPDASLAVDERMVLAHSGVTYAAVIPPSTTNSVPVT